MALLFHLGVEIVIRKIQGIFPRELISMKMLHIAAFLTFTAVSSFASAEILQKRVTQSSDDAEQRRCGGAIVRKRCIGQQRS